MADVREIVPGTVMNTKELKLGDVVEVYNGPWNTAIVCKIEPDGITLFRPYGTMADFSCGNRVICYTGIEEFKVGMLGTFKVLQRTDLK